MTNTTHKLLIATASMLLAGAGMTLNTSPPLPDNAIVLTPCEQEDSANCYWDAGTSGNGVGTSFVDIDGTAYYAE
jgi:hypothetical protein